eukprot:TRINITY_DN7206_c0_g1_i1.p1 TRINITY_DN7206_c0_g1~~TRINITY_DN7206_c0_g1_i1.p1  ORF type:complete len:123 (-),score=17.72 TRINITY_DN7206_c0_g1_i1:22-390(-)
MSSSTKSDLKQVILPGWGLFVCGSLSSMLAETCTLPIDITKIRLQLQGNTTPKKYRGMIHAGTTIVKEEGITALYKGIQPALLRQAVYSGLRVGLYEHIRKIMMQQNGGAPFTLSQRIQIRG